MKASVIALGLSILLGLAWGFTGMTRQFALEARLEPVSTPVPESFRTVVIEDSLTGLVPPGKVTSGTAMLVEQFLPELEQATVEIRDTKEKGRVQEIWLEYRSGGSVFYCEYLATAEQTIPVRYAEVDPADWARIWKAGGWGFLKGFALVLLLVLPFARRLDQ